LLRVPGERLFDRGAEGRQGRRLVGRMPDHDEV
jgi:hypothetical protein